MRNVFIYKNPDNFQKSKIICVTFLYTKSKKLYVARIFYENVEVLIYIQKEWHFALHDVFIYKKPDTSQKATKFALHFLYTKIRTLCDTQFSIEFLKLEEGGTFLYAKNNTLCVTFSYAKSNALCVTFYTKSLTLCVTFLYPKINALCVTFLYLKFIV